MTLTLAIAALLALALAGAPLFAVLLAVAMLGFAVSGINLSAVAIELYRLADTPMLVALPLFTVAGYLLGESRCSERLVRLTRAFLGWMPAGLAMVALVACALFTAFTGASGVTIVALGALLFPALLQDGYGERFSLGLVVSSGSLGLLLPPSLPLIIYGIVAQQMSAGQRVSIDDLFVAGLLPGALMVVLLGGWSLWCQRRHPTARTRFHWREALAAVRAAAWELPLPVIVLGGIYGGVLAVSEAAAATAFYTLVTEVLIYREIPLRRLAAVMRESMVMVGGILLIIGAAMAFTNYIIDAQVPMRLFAAIQGRVSDPLLFLLLLNGLLLLLGALLDIFSALVIMVPLLLPVAVSYGVDPVHLGIIFLANMQIGYITPPVGMNLFIASYRFKKSITELYRAALPFMLVLLAAVLVITYVPQLSLGLLGR